MKFGPGVRPNLPPGTGMKRKPAWKTRVGMMTAPKETTEQRAGKQACEWVDRCHGVVKQGKQDKQGGVDSMAVSKRKLIREE